jgi:hypothetical protein
VALFIINNKQEQELQQLLYLLVEKVLQTNKELQQKNG